MRTTPTNHIHAVDPMVPDLIMNNLNTTDRHTNRQLLPTISKDIVDGAEVASGVGIHHLLSNDRLHTKDVVPIGGVAIGEEADLVMIMGILVGELDDIVMIRTTNLCNLLGTIANHGTHLQMIIPTAQGLNSESMTSPKRTARILGVTESR